MNKSIFLAFDHLQCGKIFPKSSISKILMLLGRLKMCGQA